MPQISAIIVPASGGCWQCVSYIIASSFDHRQSFSWWCMMAYRNILLLEILQRNIYVSYTVSETPIFSTSTWVTWRYTDVCRCELSISAPIFSTTWKRDTESNKQYQGLQLNLPLEITKALKHENTHLGCVDLRERTTSADPGELNCSAEICTLLMVVAFASAERIETRTLSAARRLLA